MYFPIVLKKHMAQFFGIGLGSGHLLCCANRTTRIEPKWLLDAPDSKRINPPRSQASTGTEHLLLDTLTVAFWVHVNGRRTEKTKSVDKNC